MHSIDYQEMKEYQSRDAAVIVNVLPVDSFRKSHIPGSINIPFEHEDFVGEVEGIIGGKDMPVILYCASKECDLSRRAASSLLQAGFTHVMCYEGGVKEWEEKNALSAA